MNTAFEKMNQDGWYVWIGTEDGSSYDMRAHNFESNSCCDKSEFSSVKEALDYLNIGVTTADNEKEPLMTIITADLVHNTVTNAIAKQEEYSQADGVDLYQKSIEDAINTLLDKISDENDCSRKDSAKYMKDRLWDMGRDLKFQVRTRTHTWLTNYLERNPEGWDLLKPSEIKERWEQFDKAEEAYEEEQLTLASHDYGMGCPAAEEDDYDWEYQDWKHEQEVDASRDSEGRIPGDDGYTAPVNAELTDSEKIEATVNVSFTK